MFIISWCSVSLFDASKSSSIYTLCATPLKETLIIYMWWQYIDISWYGDSWHDCIHDDSYELKRLFASHVSIFDIKGVIMLIYFELTIRMVWDLKGIHYIKWETISSTYVFATSEDEPARNNIRELQYYDLMVLDHHTWINVFQSMSEVYSRFKLILFFFHKCFSQCSIIIFSKQFKTEVKPR